MRISVRWNDQKTIDKIIKEFCLLCDIFGTFTSNTGEYSGYKISNNELLTFDFERN
jgi:hypothetical protein